MYTAMDWWTKVRLNVLRGEKSKREVLREEGIHWETLKKILKYSEPPGYRLKEPRPKPKIGPFSFEFGRTLLPIFQAWIFGEKGERGAV